MMPPPNENPAHRTLRPLLGAIGDDLGDMRLAPPDVFAYLADYQINRSHIDQLVRHVRESWPSVLRIECGISCSGYPYFDIEITPHGKIDIDRHRKELDPWIRQNITRKQMIAIMLWPPLDPERIKSSTLLYERTPSPAAEPVPKTDANADQK